MRALQRRLEETRNTMERQVILRALWHRQNAIDARNARNIGHAGVIMGRLERIREMVTA